MRNKKKKLELIEIPRLELNEEGALCGGFTAIMSISSKGYQSNGNCDCNSAQNGCTGNGNCDCNGGCSRNNNCNCDCGTSSSTGTPTATGRMSQGMISFLTDDFGHFI